MTNNIYLPEGSRIGTAENKRYITSRAGLEAAMEEGRILEGIVRMCDGESMALSVDLYGVRGIIERSEVIYSADGKDTKDIAVITRVGKPVTFKVQRIEDRDGVPTAFLSRRAAQMECMRNFLMQLIPGDIVEARVTHLEPFGAFVDIGCGLISLLTVDSISVSRISHPSDRLTVGEKIMCVVKSIDYETGRIYVSQRELFGTWEENAGLFLPGQTVAGIVRSIEDYGVFVELTPNLAGLAEICGNVYPSQNCAVYIKSIIPEKMKIKLVIIDAYTHEAESRLPRQKYFIDTEHISHIDRWQYSPDVCPRMIESVFT